ncbi:hypothetical protein P3X46_018592 [Hevea brasiliensis]|uniref:Uncharacterized protein n=1 Tax=Hevea brasiliensis TaxID=3981 RepID=A0ABQ9LTD8_HEVBR|nr:hypothetical protein P3X46_018592 [Hevea brasiliensis]
MLVSCFVKFSCFLNWLAVFEFCNEPLLLCFLSLDFSFAWDWVVVFLGLYYVSTPGFSLSMGCPWKGVLGRLVLELNSNRIDLVFIIFFKILGIIVFKFVAFQFLK